MLKNLVKKERGILVIALQKYMVKSMLQLRFFRYKIQTKVLDNK